VCGRGNDALLGPALGKQGNRAEEGERRQGERVERERDVIESNLNFSQKF
jgi:hypothetical protein